MGGLRPPTPPLLLSRAKRASKPMNLVETHHVSIVLQMLGAANPRLFFGRAKRASIPMNLVELILLMC